RGRATVRARRDGIAMKHKLGLTVSVAACAGVVMLYTFVPAKALLGVSKLCRIAFALVGSGFALASWRRLDHDDPNRKRWFLLGGWLACWAAGEVAQEAYRRMLGIEPPFPSVGDLFYLLGYGFLLVAMFSFLVGWRASGFPLGNARTQAVVAVAAG